MKKIVLAGALVAMLTGCATDDVVSQPSNISSWMNPLGALTLAPSSLSEISYNDGSDVFHRQLHSSMKGDVEAISVDMGGAIITLNEISKPASKIVQTDPGIYRWSSRVQLAGNTILACENRPPESGLWAILTMAVSFLTPWVNELLIYRDAKSYNLVVFYDPGTEVITESKFIRKGSLNGASLTCEAAAAI